MSTVKMPEPVMRIYAEGSMRTVTEWRDGACDLPDGDHDLITTTQAEAYADARVREALEEAAMIPRAYAESLDRQGWGNRFPDELTAVFNASTNMADRIRALIPPLPGPVEP